MTHMDEPDEAAAEARPFLTPAPSSSSGSHHTQMLAPQGEEGSYVFAERNMISPLAISDQPWSSSAPEHMGHHSQHQNLQERFMELTQKVDEMQSDMLQLQARIQTLEGERRAADALQSQDVNTILEGEQRQGEAAQGDRNDDCVHLGCEGNLQPAGMEAQSNHYS